MLKQLKVLPPLLLSICVSLFSQTNKPDQRGFIVQIGDLAPDFEMTVIDGKTYKLSDFLGKPVMLQFTASWCSVCRKEMPFIESEIWEPYQKNGLVLFGIDRDEPLKTVVQFAKDMNISYPLALDPDADIFGLFADKKSGVTRNVIIDREGKIVFLTRLFDRDEFNEMVNKIKELISEK